MGFDKTSQCCGCAAVLLLLACAPAWAGVCRVTTGGTVFNDGSSWAAPVSLTQALSASGICTEIWAKKGVYKPTTGANTGISFSVADGVEVYGGFAGTETARDQRDPATNITVLSGDIDNNDTTDANGVDADPSHIVGANSVHVITMSLTTSSTVLDGFTVTGGHAPGTGAADTFVGGGLLCDCSTTLSRLVFRGNSASQKGGAVYAARGPALRDILFTGNQAGDEGGALSINTFDAGTITLANVAFSNNQAFAGGALSATASAATTLELTNVSFSNNSGHGGGAFFAHTQSDDTHTKLTNVTFSGNVASGSGGALFLQSGAVSNSDIALTNVTFNANQASAESGGAIYSDRQAGNALALRNVILWGDIAPLGQHPEIAYANNSAVATIDHSIVNGSGGSGGWNGGFGTDGGGNLDVDPRLGALAYDRRGTQTMVPAVGSPAIDSGNGTGCPSNDQRAIVRPQGAACDIGAVETFVVDLIGHKGQEACWSKATTEPAFLGLVHTGVEGNTACIPPFVFNYFNGSTLVQYTVCYAAACPGGALGCPITTHAGPFADDGDFGAGQFSAAGTADNLTLVGASGFGTCNYSASGITTSYSGDYLFTGDGNHGDYAALLNQFIAAPSAVGLSGAGSDPNCALSATAFYPYFYAYATAAMSVSLQHKLQSPTVGQSVCPVP